MTTRQILEQKSCILVALLVFVGLFAGCNNDKSDNVKPFEFLGEAIDRPENFDKDTIVTPENIDSLYRQYNVEAIFNGDYYLIRSKQSYKTSRYLSRLIQMKNGKQVAAKTFYDSEIDVNMILRLKNKIIIGLNSLRENNYDSTYHKTTHQCRIFVLSDSLTPIAGKRFYSQKGHTYIESLMQNSDSTFFCSIVSGDFEPSPYAHYQFRARNNLYIERQTYITNYYEYEIRSEGLDLSKHDWGNDLSDDYIKTLKSSEKAANKKHDNSTLIKSSIPSNFIFVPSGKLTHLFVDYDEQFNPIYKNFSVNSFYICKYEVTQREYKAIIGKNPSKYVGEELPVHNITNAEALNFCQKKSEKEGYDGFYTIKGNKVFLKQKGNGYRLPTDHEWAFAARKGDEAKAYKYAAGNKLNDIAWYGRNSNNRPHKIGLKKPNDRGLYDMCGNVGELAHIGRKEIWSKGGSYEQWPYDGHVFHEDAAGGYSGGRINSKEKDPTAGIRLVFIPKGMEPSFDF